MVPSEKLTGKGMNMSWEYDDGGRKAAGFSGTAGDCVVRAVVIATQQEYADTYRELSKLNGEFSQGWSRAAKRQRKRGATAREGTNRQVYQPYMESLGWRWVPTMQIGSGCRVHLQRDELPTGRLVCRVSKHMVAVVDGVIHDTYDCSRGGTRCVYGYFQKVSR